MRANTGALPPLEIATVIGDRSTMAGMMKSECAGLSTALTGMLRTRAASDTAVSTVSSPVAAKTMA